MKKFNLRYEIDNEEYRTTIEYHLEQCGYPDGLDIDVYDVSRVFFFGVEIKIIRRYKNGDKYVQLFRLTPEQAVAFSEAITQKINRPNEDDVEIDISGNWIRDGKVCITVDNQFKKGDHVKINFTKFYYDHADLRAYILNRSKALEFADVLRNVALNAREDTAEWEPSKPTQPPFKYKIGMVKNWSIRQ